MTTIKTWQERLGADVEPHATPMGAIECAMQAEIDELRQANAKLKADANTCGSGAGCCHQAAVIEKLEAENARLQAVLKVFADALPADRDTVKTCYAVTNAMRDAAHAALEMK